MQSTWFVYRFQALKLNPIEYLRFINCYGKANRETHALAQWHLTGHRLFVSESIGSVFYLHAAIFEIPMYRFVIKPPACWGADVSINIYQLLLVTPLYCYISMVLRDIFRVFFNFSELLNTVKGRPWKISKAMVISEIS